MNIGSDKVLFANQNMLFNNSLTPSRVNFVNVVFSFSTSLNISTANVLAGIPQPTHIQSHSSNVMELLLSYDNHGLGLIQISFLCISILYIAFAFPLVRVYYLQNII